MEWCNIPNTLSAFRIIATPGLLYLAWHGFANAFLVLLVLAFLSDLLDGLIARLLNQSSELGAQLDSWGDATIYISLPICAWWLRPDIIRQEIVFVCIAVLGLVLPAMLEFVKFGRLSCYHTWASKISAALISISILLIFAFSVTWLFRWAAIFQILVALEIIAITILLPTWQCNIQSVWHAINLIKPKNILDR
ncbi:phosphatidylglycerophosphate synthase [Candidatus Thiomargarita nelsonii]|uniref:Phosphatidylglycerophosphate synthase n=1 Tax=Candidatus Thiomargarita nelsonii TaxID=1003181 RepID=A0A176RUN4_9GAMM|nr:phosphatidylglycerophosphate synthase [Candidatus Thiomargarita nelsonii]